MLLLGRESPHVAVDRSSPVAGCQAPTTRTICVRACVHSTLYSRLDTSRLDTRGLASRVRSCIAEALRPTLSGSTLLRSPPYATAIDSWAITRKGFRPFFLLAAVFALGIVPLWLLVLHGTLRIASYLDPVSWHSHEMIFGFVLAVIAGFLLTAVGNWTQRETAVGAPLAGLAALWAVGRVAMSLSALLPRSVVAVADLAFLPVLLVVLGRPLLATSNRRNYAMLGVLGALFLANLAVHFEALGVLPMGSARRATLVGVDLVLLIITVIAGRTFPSFTRNATGVASIRSIPALDVLAIGAMVAVVLSDALPPMGRVGALLPALAGVFAAGRALHWGVRHTLKQPLLWILHAGYAWLALGLIARGFSAAQGSIFGSQATHALTVGAIGSLTLGMMARVALGHTGRMLVAPSAMAAAFVAINLAALVRVFLPLLVPDWYFASLVAAGTLWFVAFATFLVIYTPMLLRPRVDGKPG